MAYFGRPGSSIPQYHTYVPESVSLQNIGLASYTRNSFNNFGYKNTDTGKILDKDIEEYFGGPPPKTLLGDSNTLSILYYDVENNRHILKQGSEIFKTENNFQAASNLKDFQEKWDIIQRGFGDTLSKNTVSGIVEVWANIKNSLSGCITFSTSTYPILGCSEKSNVQIFFTSTGKTSSSRKVAQKGMPTFVVEPKDNAFQPYSHFNTSSLPPGQSILPGEGGSSNPDNSIAADPQYRFDNVTGKIEFGTFQTLATLLSDLEGVDTPDLPNNIDLLQFDSYNLSEAKTAYALPLTAHNGNPRIIGPNSYDCGGFKKQKILVTNITPRSYEAGDLIICSMVNGIWIPMGYKDPSLVPKKFEVSWSEMQKYIVNAHSFFRNSDNSNYITPDEYVGHFRYKYYTDMPEVPDSRIRILNLLGITSEEEVDKKDNAISLKNSNVTEAPNYSIYLFNKKPAYRGYLSVCDADQIHTSLGGNNTYANCFINTNLDQLQIDDPETGITFALSAPFNWGMFFPKGYQSVGVSNLKNYKGEISVRGGTAIEIDEENKTATATGAGAIYIPSGNLDFTTPTTFNIGDRNLYHFPAQMALNSKKNPTKNYTNLWSIYSLSNYYSYIDQFIGTAYGEYLLKSDGSDLYNLTPISPQNIHFYPLQMELALCDTYIDYEPFSPETYNQKGYLNLKQQLEAGWQEVLNILKRVSTGQPNRSTGFFLGNMWKRNYIANPVIVKSSNPKILSSIGFSDDALLNLRNLPPTVEKDKTNTPPVGGPNIFPHIHYDLERSNVVGILAAKATINMPRGGQLTFNTENRFGARSYSITTISNSSIVSTVIGSIAAFTTDNSGQNRDISIKQWGASDEGKPRSFGTTALFCRVYDHYENTIYDGRYFAPLHFNPATGVAFDEPNLPIGSKINSNNSSNVKYTSNNIRAKKLISGNGFTYIQKYIGINPSDIQILDGGVAYQNEKVRLKFGGAKGAVFLVDVENGAITKNNLKIISEGEYSAQTFNSSLDATILAETDGDEVLFNSPAKIRVSVGTVMEKLMNDPAPEYTEIMLTPSSNKGGGENKGIVTSNLTKSVSLNTNSTGKYDVFFFFANDIIHTPITNTSINAYDSFFPAANYVKLEMSAG